MLDKFLSAKMSHANKVIHAKLSKVWFLQSIITGSKYFSEVAMILLTGSRTRCWQEKDAQALKYLSTYWELHHLSLCLYSLAIYIYLFVVELLFIKRGESWYNKSSAYGRQLRSVLTNHPRLWNFSKRILVVRFFFTK